MATNQQVTTLNFSLPESMRAFIEAQVAKGAYTSASEYLRELVREAQKKAAHEVIEAKLLGSLQSGDPIKLSDEYWSSKRANIIERHKKAKRG
jgi:antitoxin ParD1/3/4